MMNYDDNLWIDYLSFFACDNYNLEYEYYKYNKFMPNEHFYGYDETFVPAIVIKQTPVANEIATKDAFDYSLLLKKECMTKKEAITKRVHDVKRHKKETKTIFTVIEKTKQKNYIKYKAAKYAIGQHIRRKIKREMEDNDENIENTTNLQLTNEIDINKETSLNKEHITNNIQYLSNRDGVNNGNDEIVDILRKANISIQETLNCTKQNMNHSCKKSESLSLGAKSKGKARNVHKRQKKINKTSNLDNNTANDIDKSQILHCEKSLNSECSKGKRRYIKRDKTTCKPKCNVNLESEKHCNVHKENDQMALLTEVVPDKTKVKKLHVANKKLLKVDLKNTNSDK